MNIYCPKTFYNSYKNGFIQTVNSHPHFKNNQHMHPSDRRVLTQRGRSYLCTCVVRSSCSFSSRILRPYHHCLSSFLLARVTVQPTDKHFRVYKKNNRKKGCLLQILGWGGWGGEILELTIFTATQCPYSEDHNPFMFMSN